MKVLKNDRNYDGPEEKKEIRKKALAERLQAILFFRRKKEQTLRSRALKILAGFLVLMIIFTFLSRAADSFTVAQVQVENPSSRVIEHQISASGRVVQNRETAVLTESGLQVEAVCVNVGDSVKAGDVLLQLNMEQLDETISEAEKEKETLELNNEALKRNRSLQESARDTAIRQAQENYEAARTENAAAVENAKKELEQAQKELDAARQQQTEPGDENGSDDGESVSSLESLVQEKQQAYEDAVSSQESSLREARQALESAKAPLEEDNTDRINNLSLDTCQKKLQKLNALKQAGGKITAESDGIITDISLTAGSMTTEEAAMRMADLNAGVRFVAQVSPDEEKYLTDDAEISISLDGNTPAADGLSITSVTQNAEDPEMLDVSVSLPDDSLSVGQTAVMTITQQSAKCPCTVSLPALREDSGRPYVLVIEKQNTVLGEEWYARKVEVNVLDKNDSYAALKEGAISEDDTVITSSNKTIGDGDRVRLEP